MAFQVLDCGFLVSGTWIPDFTGRRGFGFHTLSSGFQNPFLHIPPAKLSRIQWSVCMRVCKHGCAVKMFCFSRANYASTNFLLVVCCVYRESRGPMTQLSLIIFNLIIRLWINFFGLDSIRRKYPIMSQLVVSAVNNYAVLTTCHREP